MLDTDIARTLKEWVWTASMFSEFKGYQDHEYSLLHAHGSATGERVLISLVWDHELVQMIQATCADSNAPVLVECVPWY